jgi:transposase
VVTARTQWRQRLKGVDPGRLVFVDESGAKTNLTRLRGRCDRGERLLCKTPAGHWNTTTMIAAVRLGGAIAGAVVKGPMDAEVFIAWVREALTPGLRPGDIVVMDNLQPHKNPAVRRMIEAMGCELWLLPPYSPDLNPIEMMWSKVKQLIRGAEPRTFETLIQAVFGAMDAVTAADAEGFFRCCGYHDPLI